MIREQYPYPWDKPDAQWVMSWRVEPPNNVVLFGKTGVSRFFCSYSQIRDRWDLIAPGGEEQIAMPEFIWLSEQWAKDHPSTKVFPPEKPRMRRSKKPQQMELL